jgi:hypothetical protein
VQYRRKDEYGAQAERMIPTYTYTSSQYNVCPTNLGVIEDRALTVCRSRSLCTCPPQEEGPSPREFLPSSQCISSLSIYLSVVYLTICSSSARLSPSHSSVHHQASRWLAAHRYGLRGRPALFLHLVALHSRGASPDVGMRERVRPSLSSRRRCRRRQHLVGCWASNCRGAILEATAHVDPATHNLSRES